ncbi:MAG: endopeptidase La [Pseudomonadales bacterium]|nr:endopeptidase La [Pseudomonadales bacterium]MDP6471877.1 endopeptidase La [Pseudomonadales bacterium]MDP6826853.1 endopeptidase La [Pseudomonadales bacterium]MDP6970869.1 endopeptidase La [Pseudomonadales bacterium]
MPETYPVLPLKNTVVYPQIVVPLAVGRPRSLAAVSAATESGRRIITVAQRQADTEDPSREELFDVGTIISINRIEKRENGAQVIVQGLERVRISTIISDTPCIEAEYERLPSLSIEDLSGDSAHVDALLRENLEIARSIANLYDADNGAQIYQQLIGSIADPVTQMYRIASLANLDLEQEQQVLACNTARELMETVHDLLQHEHQVTELRRQIAERAREDMDQQQREHVLRQQKRAIEVALGEGDDDEDIAELRQQLKDAQLPDNVRDEVDRELKRLGRMSANAADYQVARAYLELVAELPWHESTKDQLDLEHAQKILDEDHYGLEDVKERILESLAVMQLNPEAKAPILCFVGPPGVGKTSLGQSIARAMGRKFERLSLGGLHDEAELRGHRRTYIGAMPGRILQGVRRAGVTNPLLMLDEVDKLGRDFRGDPAAALMEILDPAQNCEFRDNYLNLPYDLSGVLFITTANTLEGVPRPLLDRMEVLELSGYSDMEKHAIARQYLIPRQRTEAGVKDAQLNISDDALQHMIRRYTREAGVRELERVIGRLARKRARQVVEKRRARKGINIGAVTDMLGPERFQSDTGRHDLSPGVAAGLAWMESGGDVLYVEATVTSAEEKITLTGHLGQVMQESARAARSYIWSVAEQIGIDRAAIDARGIHIHVPAGAVPKDGPSAGVTMATAIASAYSGKPVRDDLAMTGELTLSGLVLPVGGVKEKVLAAHRAGIRHLVLPRENESDLTKLPDTVRESLTVHLASHLEDVLVVALPGLNVKKTKAGTSVRKRKAKKTSVARKQVSIKKTKRTATARKKAAKKKAIVRKRPAR